MSRKPKVDIVREEIAETSEVVINCHYDYGERPMVVKSYNSETYGRSCALTPKISEMVPRKPFEIQQVSFTFLSRDQGWGGDSHVRGHYEGSWTWFDARIIRNVDTAPINTASPAGDLESKEQIVTVQNLDGDTSTKDSSVPRTITTASVTGHDNWNYNHADVRILYEDPDIWTVQRNRRANAEYYEHRVVWRRGDPVEPAPVLSYVDQTGRGQSYGFVEALGMDDRIAVIAKAKLGKIW
ncbi:hypothetical protein CVT24_002313 [Panaeolus cyanescens]|uniref:Uncharacterized protein n=1 Tax=Panaeolus cyanescens TaxID=181874 RepID=A0A409WJR0_9AGAR|nr:hypothetical protein CVT24_002313 [Panaeolus cyanescens]